MIYFLFKNYTKKNCLTKMVFWWDDFLEKNRKKKKPKPKNNKLSLKDKIF